MSVGDVDGPFCADRHGRDYRAGARGPRGHRRPGRVGSVIGSFAMTDLRAMHPAAVFERAAYPDGHARDVSGNEERGQPRPGGMTDGIPQIRSTRWVKSLSTRRSTKNGYRRPQAALLVARLAPARCLWRSRPGHANAPQVAARTVLRQAHWEFTEMCEDFGRDLERHLVFGGASARWSRLQPEAAAAPRNGCRRLQTGAGEVPCARRRTRGSRDDLEARRTQRRTSGLLAGQTPGAKDKLDGCRHRHLRT